MEGYGLKNVRGPPFDGCAIREAAADVGRALRLLYPLQAAAAAGNRKIDNGHDLPTPGYGNLQGNQEKEANRGFDCGIVTGQGRRGRIAKSDTQNLRERLRKHGSEALRFASDPNFASANNFSERGFRMSKVKMKVSSYLQSMAALGCNPLEAIQIALAGDVAKFVDPANQPPSIRQVSSCIFYSGTRLSLETKRDSKSETSAEKNNCKPHFFVACI